MIQFEKYYIYTLTIVLEGVIKNCVILSYTFKMELYLSFEGDPNVCKRFLKKALVTMKTVLKTTYLFVEDFV